MRYQKIESKIWNDEKFTSLTPMQQRLFFYILTCPHGNLIGLYVLKYGYICEDLKCLPKDLAKDLRSLSERELIYYDHSTQVVLVKNFLKHNPLTNPNQRKAAAKIFSDLPKSILLLKFLELNKDLTEVLPEVLPEVLLKPETETEEETETEVPPPISPPSGGGAIKSKLKKNPLPQNFAITPTVQAWADDHGYTNLTEHLEYFRDWAVSNGKQYADWNAVFRNAVRGNWAKINGGKVKPVNYCDNHPGKKSSLMIDGRYYCRDCLNALDKKPEPADVAKMQNIIGNVTAKLRA